MAKPEKESASIVDEFKENNEAARVMAIKSPVQAMDDDLPENVRRQLVGYDYIELEKQIYTCLVSLSPGVVTVDKIIMAMWHHHKKVAERAKVIRTLNAMSITGKINKQISPRGYTLPEKA